MMNNPTYGKRIIRHLMVILGIVILIWSGIEDNDVIGVTALGAMSASAFTLRLLTRRSIGRLARDTDLLKLTVMSGMLIGALSCLSTTLLMLFKNIRHGHVFPDYPPQLMLAMLERLPLWTLAGGLAGLGIGLLLKLRRERRNERL